MRILILGASGMLGHRLMIELSKHHEVYGTLHKNFELARLRSDLNCIPMSLGYMQALGSLGELSLDVVINCIAAIPQGDVNTAQMIMYNAHAPHVISNACEEYKARLIHFSTDGVFSGKRGDYTEADTPDATDVYGMTKRLGEISDKPHVLTLRCCPIGREIGAKKSLVEWFLAQAGTVKGYANAKFTGLTTHEIARIVNQCILPRPDLHGLYHVGGAPISKYDLLNQLKYISEHDVNVDADYSVQPNRTLNSKRFFDETRYVTTTWNSMIDEMAADNALYEGVTA